MKMNIEPIFFYKNFNLATFMMSDVSECASLPLCKAPMSASFDIRNTETSAPVSTISLLICILKILVFKYLIFSIPLILLFQTISRPDFLHVE